VFEHGFINYGFELSLHTCRFISVSYMSFLVARHLFVLAIVTAAFVAFVTYFLACVVCVAFDGNPALCT